MSSKYLQRTKEYLAGIREDSNPAPDEVAHAPKYLQPSYLEENVVGLRQKIHDEPGGGSSTNTLKAKINDILQRNNVVTDNNNPNYDQGIYREAYDIYKQAAGYTKEEWRTESTNTQGDTASLSPRDQTVARLVDSYSKPAWEAMAKHDEKLDDLQAEAAAIAKEWSALLAKRADAIGFDWGGKQSKKKEELSDLITAISNEIYFKGIEGGENEKTLIAAIDKFTQDSTAVIAANMEQARLDRKAAANPMFKAAAEWWAKHSSSEAIISGRHPLISRGTFDEIFSKRTAQILTSRENLKNTAMKAVPVAIGSLAVGAVLSATVGTAGVAIGAASAAAGAVYVSKRLAKSFAIVKLNQAGSAEKVAAGQRKHISDTGAVIRHGVENYQADGVASLKAIEDRKQVLLGSIENTDNEKKIEFIKKRLAFLDQYAGRSEHEMILTMIDQQTDAYRRANRLRFVASTAIGAVFGAAGVAIGGIIGEHFSGAASDHSGGGESNDGTGSTVESGVGNADGEGSMGTGAETLIPSDKTVGSISAGEGFYSVFGEMGVDPSHNAELMQEVGPQLQEMGVAYEAATDVYGWDMTGDLPPEANELILSTAHEHGWMGSTGIVSNPEVDGLSDDFTVEAGHGYTQELIDAAADRGVEMTPEQAWQARTEIVDRVGPDYVDLAGHDGSDTYSMGSSSYETGISAPGEAAWAPEAHDLIDDATDDGVINGSTGVDHDVATPDIDATDAVVDSGDAPSDAQIVEQSDLQGLEDGLDNNADWADASRDFEAMQTLIQNGDIQAINSNPEFRDTLDMIGRDLGTIKYVDSDTTMMEFNTATGHWQINTPDGDIPDQAYSVLDRYQQSLYDLAA